ncbi:MAG TPA: peptidylprolyl isomerase [Bacteroidia bacterium]|jgi:peptidyl-prolyl cis-trans isomerase SurA|nr:peptidylprolyl isomerase [Bacteroidia bacterium]
MNKYVIALSTLFITASLNAQTQTDPVLLTIDGKPITKSEFEAVYKKNNGKDMSAEKKTVREYLDLFINFKLKVKEAEQMGLDTAQAFKQELGGYKKQLSAPYLTDKDVTDNLVKEAYERGKTEINASHILIRCPEDALPKDTIEAWQRISMIRNIILGKSVSKAQLAEYEANVKKNHFNKPVVSVQDSQEVMRYITTLKDLAAGKNIDKKKDEFTQVAKLTSEEPGAKETGGNLGYGTALDWVYPFESAAYNTKVGEISTIVRTRYGYHILKVIDKRPNSGEILVAHIMLRLTKEMKHEDSLKVKQKIDEMYAKLKAGEKFEDLVKNYSEDKQTAPNGGELSWFYERKFQLEDFAKRAFALKANGDYTEPFQTKYGWHIVKRIDKRDLPSFDAMKTELKNKVSRDSRSFLSKTSFIAKIKKEYNFKEVPKTKEEFNVLIDTNYFKASWKASAAGQLNKEMFSLADKKYTQSDFAKYLESHQTRRAKTDAAVIVNAQYKNYVEETLLAYEESQLDRKYPDYRNLMQEYRDGILLFDLTDRKVWSKAVKDSTGLQAFYEKNKNNYLWDERADVSTYKCANAEIAKEVRKMLEKKKSEKEILEKINKKSQLDVAVETVTYLKGENKNIDANWKEGISADINQDGKVLILMVNKLMPKSPKKLAECRGLVTADYQNFLEKDWIANLRNNHKIEVKDDVLATVK